MIRSNRYLIWLWAASLAIGPRSAAAHSLLGSSQNQELFNVDLSAATATPIGSMLPWPLATEIEFGGPGKLLYGKETDGKPNLHIIDPSTGASQGTVSIPNGALPGLEFVGNTLYGTFMPSGGAQSSLVIVDPATGSMTTVGPTGLGPISGLAWDGQTLYGVSAGNSGGGTSGLYTISLSTGAATLVGPIADASAGRSFNAVGSIEFGANGVLYGGISQGGAYLPRWIIAIDKNTGTATPGFETPYSITGLTLMTNAAPPVAVPALGPWGLLVGGVGLSLLGLRRRRFRTAD